MVHARYDRFIAAGTEARRNVIDDPSQTAEAKNRRAASIARRHRERPEWTGASADQRVVHWPAHSGGWLSESSRAAESSEARAMVTPSPTGTATQGVNTRVGSVGDAGQYE
jgi:hypothetical protein